MDVQHLRELLSEILQRLDVIEAKIHNPNQSIARRRQESLDAYRRAYNRQHGYSEDIPANPDAQDEVG